MVKVHELSEASGQQENLCILPGIQMPKSKSNMDAARLQYFKSLNNLKEQALKIKGNLYQPKKLIEEGRLSCLPSC